MCLSVKYTKLENIQFEKIQEYINKETDTRFMKCKIWLMHMGKNLNNSYFDKSVVEEALPSLANTPILAYIEENSKGELDVSDHRQVLEKDKNGNYDLVYKGQAIGVIPETNNATFEMRLCDDGIEREFLVVDGLVWTKWKDVNDIFENENIKGQSMELDPDSYTGHFGDDNTFHFDKFKFFGACAISVQPAMINSTIEVEFSTKINSDEINNKLKEFETYFMKKEVDQEGMKKDNTKFENEDEIKEPELDNSEENDDVGEPAIENEVKDDEKSEDIDTEEACGDKKKKYTLTYELSYEDKRCKIYEKLSTVEELNNSWCYIFKTFDNRFIYTEEIYVDGNFETKIYEQLYKEENDEIIFTDPRKELFNVLVDEETYNQIKDVTYSQLQEQLNSAKEEVDKFSVELGETKLELENAKKEVKELSEFKANIDEENRKEEIDNVLSKFSAIDSLDIELYRVKAYNKEIELDALENTLYAEVGKLNMSNFSANAKEDTSKRGARNYASLKENENKDEKYAELSYLFTKKNN